LHALWTLEGLDLLTPELLFETLDDDNIPLQTASLRLLEPFANNDAVVRARLGLHMKKMVKEIAPAAIPQIAFTAAALDEPQAHEILETILNDYDAAALLRDAVLSSLEDQEFMFMKRLTHSDQWKMHEPEKEIFFEMLTTAVLRNAKPSDITALLALLGNPH